MAKHNARVGRLSVWLSIIGTVLPVLLEVLFFFIRHDKPLKSSAVITGINGLTVMLFFALQLIALCCGITDWYTTPGKTGLAISSFTIILVLILASL